jgi:hypothetical protein
MTTPVQRMVGMTLDDPWEAKKLASRLAALPNKPWIRVVCDKDVKAAEYREPLEAFRPHVAGIMLELLDSFDVKSFSAAAYSARAIEYWNELHSLTDVWEVMNEINGGPTDKEDWVGRATSWEKTVGALRFLKAKGARTACTFYLEPTHAMFPWIEKHVAYADGTLLDYALISYYEKDNDDWSPPWQPIFDGLGKLFPNALLGVGECGDDRDDARALDCFTRYYRNFSVKHERFVGGFFWWFQAQLLNNGGPLYSEIAKMLR